MSLTKDQKSVIWKCVSLSQWVLLSPDVIMEESIWCACMLHIIHTYMLWDAFTCHGNCIYFEHVWRLLLVGHGTCGDSVWEKSRHCTVADADIMNKEFCGDSFTPVAVRGTTVFGTLAALFSLLACNVSLWQSISLTVHAQTDRRQLNIFRCIAAL